MNAELPPFTNGELNSESASTIDHVVTPSRKDSPCDELVVTEHFKRKGGVNNDRSDFMFQQTLVWLGNQYFL